jgi:hypothetical protein
MQGYPNLAGQELANEVDKQPWDPSVKALTQFPSVLASMTHVAARASAENSTEGVSMEAGAGNSYSK